jgi:hypothetical protein
MTSIEETDCRANDVLFGRGSGPSKHEGNRRFRGVVWETFQGYLQIERARHCSRGEMGNDVLPPSLSAATKSRLCQIIREKIAKMDGRFLQKVTSASVAATPDSDENMTCVTHNERGIKEVGNRHNLKTYYRIVDERQVLSKIKQTLRFLLEQKYGRKERSDVVRVAAAVTASRKYLGEPSYASTAVVPTGILHESQTWQDMPPVPPTDVLARLLLECPVLPQPPLMVVPLQQPHAASLNMDISSQLLLLLQQRQQQRRKENERALGLLQLLGPGRDAIMALHGRNAGNASRLHQALAVSMSLSHSGLSGCGGIISK